MRGNMKNLKHFTTTRGTYSNGNYSSFWLDDEFDRQTSIFDDEEDVKPKTDLIALSSYRRAIGNFVRIVTQQDIPVTFKSSGDSYTDGKKVVISANIPTEYFNQGETKGYSKWDVMGHIKNLLNYVEDRRIDNFVFTSSPGYKGYYHSMYDKYFHSKIIDAALDSDEHTEENMESYMFRIINLTNKNTNLSALNGLRDIWNTIGLKNIGRLKSTEDAFKVACEIYYIILKNLPETKVNVDKEGNETYEKAQDSGQGQPSQGGGGDDTEISDEQFEDLLSSIENGELTAKPTEKEEEEVEVDENKNLLTPQQQKQLANAIKKQQKFMDGEVQKKNVTKAEKGELETIESSGMGYVEVGDGLTTWDGKKMKTKCVVVREFTKQLVENNSNISIISKYHGDHYGDESYYRNDTYVEDGIRLGTILGRKLQVRGESRETKWTRLDSGKIDKRLISELGFGNDRVFSNSFVEEYSDAFLHISVDASGSMGGDKWTNTMKSVIAICKAIDMVNNVDVVVSFRSTISGDYRSRMRNTDKPLILIAYDSRKDSFQKVKNLFKYVTYGGTTPEGLCFEAIMNEIEPTVRDRDSYFLNFSDGMPMFSNNDLYYYDNEAIGHTKKMVKEFRNRGIKVLSYFIGSGGYRMDREMEDFKKMYGGDSEFIDVTSVMSVSKTMNKKFLQK